MFFAGSKRHLVYVQSAVLDRLGMFILGPFAPDFRRKGLGALLAER